MEETIGKLWHGLITRNAEQRYPAAAVRLREIERTAGVYFRALGGDPGLRIAAATIDPHRGRRGLFARIAGIGDKLAQARMDQATLRLPPEIDCFPARSLNRDLYLWLAALAAAHDRLPDDTSYTPDEAGDFRRNQAATCCALATWPGIGARYRRLVEAYLPTRIDPTRLPAAEAERERAIRHALAVPGSVLILPAVSTNAPAAEPVRLWLSGALG
ncbi:MAG: nitric oxide reductase, partial [Rhodocyclaceae bacterium]|nr:nitric oxide reductase [Rhodocyclaceae bacterium]